MKLVIKSLNFTILELGKEIVKNKNKMQNRGKYER